MCVGSEAAGSELVKLETSHTVIGTDPNGESSLIHPMKGLTFQHHFCQIDDYDIGKQRQAIQ